MKIERMWSYICTSFFFLIQDNSLLSLVEKVANFAHIYLYNQTTAYSVLHAPWLKDNALLNDFRHNLYTWGNNYSTEDLAKIENEYGISRDDFETLYKAAKSLSQCLACPTDEGTPLRKLSLIIYSDQIDKIESLAKKLQDLYDGVNEDVQNEPFLITRDLGKRNIPKEIIKMPNPYHQIPNACSSIESFISEVKSNNEDPSMKSFVFTTQFQLLSTFSTDIKDKGLDEDEVQELKSVFSTLLIRGFLLNQITIKLSQKEILTKKNDMLDKRNLSDGNDEEVQSLSEMSLLRDYFRLIYEKTPDLDDEKLNRINQNHSDDDLTPILKPLVEELIPYYKSLIADSGYAQLTYQVSNKYQKVLVPTFQKSIIEGVCPNKFMINPIYIDFLPFTVIDPPNETYKIYLDIFKECYYNHVFHHGSFSTSRDPKMPYLPEEIDDIEDLDTLQNQKYFIVNYMVSFIVSLNKNAQFNLQDACLILSLLNWKVDIDCKEGNDLDQYFKELINISLRRYDYAGKSNLLKHFAKYIISTVNVATEPLNTSEMKQKLSSLSNQASHGEEPDGSSPLGGCCLIQ